MTSSLHLHTQLIKDELKRRCKLNSRYSLRSFAKNLDMDPSLLSKILNQNRAMSIEIAKNLMEKIRFSDNEKRFFWKSYLLHKEELLNSKIPTSASSELKSKNEVIILEFEQYKMISEPYHYLIVELASLSNFKSNPEWISKVIGLSKSETIEAIQRLLDLGMLKKENGKLKRSEGRFISANKENTNEALKIQQKKILEQARDALENIPIPNRSQESMTIAINPDKIPIAKKYIQEFIDQLSNVLEQGPLKEVYQLSLSLFPLTQFELQKENNNKNIESKIK